MGKDVLIPRSGPRPAPTISLLNQFKRACGSPQQGILTIPLPAIFCRRTPKIALPHRRQASLAWSEEKIKSPRLIARAFYFCYFPKWLKGIETTFVSLRR